jgi:hypothetical protein
MFKDGVVKMIDSFDPQTDHLLRVPLLLRMMSPLLAKPDASIQNIQTKT